MVAKVRIKNKGPTNIIVSVISLHPNGTKYPRMYLRPNEEARPFAVEGTYIRIDEDKL